MDVELIGGVGVSESARFIGDEVVFKTIEEFEGRCGCATEEKDGEKEC